MFSYAVATHWGTSSTSSTPDQVFLVVIDPSLTPTRSVSLLSVNDGPRIARVTPERAAQLSVTDGDAVPLAELGARIKAAGLAVHGADYLFYLPAEHQVLLRSETAASGIRQLTDADEALFARFADEASEDDLDDAFVELDHWKVFGAIVEGRLVSAASAYPWDGSTLADVGVITLPEFRGRGLARATVRALSASALNDGFEPQYRCQLDHAASVALAASAGFALFGEWDVVVEH